MNGYVCSGTGGRLCLLQLTPHVATYLKASEPIYHCHSNTQSGPTSPASREAIVPCLGGGAPRRALPPPGSGGSRRRARSAEGAVAPRACRVPAQPRFPRSIPAAERVTMTIGNACQARWLATAAGQFSKTESLSLVPPACGRFSYHLVPISVQTPQAPGAPWRSLGRRGSQGCFPA